MFYVDKKKIIVIFCLKSYGVDNFENNVGKIS